MKRAVIRIRYNQIQHPVQDIKREWEHNHPNGIKYKAVRAESQEYSPFSTTRLS